MKHLLITTIAAVVLMGCGESQQSAPAPEAKPEPTTVKAPDISIHDAARTGNIEAVKQHLADGAEVNAKSSGGRTPLHDAAFSDLKEVAELLIANGADVNVKSKFGETPLDLAIINNETETADLLREHGGKTTPEGYSDTIADDRTSAERRRTEIIGEVGRIGIGAAIERLTEEAVKSALP